MPTNYVGRVLVVTALLLVSHGLLAADKGIEGTWRISRPESTFKPVDGAVLPFTDKGRKLYETNEAARVKGDYEAFDMTMARCASPGPPRLMLTPDRFKIFIRDDVVFIMFEWNRLLRQIDMHGKPFDPDFGNVAGMSWGHWNGKVLEVESRGFSHKRLLDRALPNSEDLKLVERIQRIGPDTLEDRITIDDPQIFTRSWDTVVTYKRQRNEVFPEDVCLKRKGPGQLPLPPG
jgi:hypothetical protein